MEKILRQAGEMVLDLATRKGVAAEAYLLHSRDLNIELRDNQIETLKQAEEMGLGLRVVNKGRIGFAFTSDINPAALTEAVNNAVAISAYTSSDEHNHFPGPGCVYPAIDTFDTVISATPLQDKIDLAREMENTARAIDHRIVQVEKAGYEESEFSLLLMNSHGLYAFGQGNYCGLHIFLLAQEEGDAQNGFAFMLKKKIQELSPAAVGEEGAQHALRSLGARIIPSGKMPCVMEPYVVTRFMGVLAQSVGADSVQKGKSMLAGKLGERVASSLVNLVDDGLSKDSAVSFPFDGEGVPARKTVVIANGILNDYLYDNYTAHKAGCSSSGNGRRGSFRSLPVVAASNFILEPGRMSLPQMISDIDKGLYITEVMGMHTANSISGDFSVGAAGIMIENGCLAYPVRGITIAGNLADFLRDIDALGNDLRYYGGRAAPSLRLGNISVSGS